MTDYCEFSELPASVCSHCHPPEATAARPQVPGEKADSAQARSIFRSMVLGARADAVVRDRGNADEVTVDGVQVWVKATIARDGTATSFQFHDAVKMLAIKVDYLALVNTAALDDVEMIRKSDADDEARVQMRTSVSGRVTLKPRAPRLRPHLRTVAEVFGPSAPAQTGAASAESR